MYRQFFRRFFVGGQFGERAPAHKQKKSGGNHRCYERIVIFSTNVYKPNKTVTCKAREMICASEH